MPPRPITLWCRAGTVLRATVVVTDDAQPVDLTGVPVTFQVAPQPGASPAFAWATEPAVVVDGPAGTIEVAVPGVDTATLTGYRGRWEWALLADFPGGGKMQLASGPLTVLGSLA